MKKDIMLVRIPSDGYMTEEVSNYNKKYFEDKFSKWYEVIISYDYELKKIEVELINPIAILGSCSTFFKALVKVS